MYIVCTTKLSYRKFKNKAAHYLFAGHSVSKCARVAFIFWMCDSSHRLPMSLETNVRVDLQMEQCGTKHWPWHSVIIQASKEPDGEVKVSVKILFLEWGVYLRFYFWALSISLCTCLSQSFSLSLFSSLSNPRSALFYQILSQGASQKTNRAHQDWAPEDQFG